MLLNLLNHILAARNDDVEGWMQILVFVIIAVFWVIKNAVKVIKPSKEQQDEEGYEEHEESQARPDYKASHEDSNQIDRILDEQPSREDQIIRSMKYESQAADIEKIEKDIEKTNVTYHYDSHSFESKPIFEKETTVEMPEDHFAGHESREDVIEILTSEDKRNNLRNAVILNEILNKPISLRENDQL